MGSDALASLGFEVEFALSRAGDRGKLFMLYQNIKGDLHERFGEKRHSAWRNLFDFSFEKKFKMIFLLKKAT